MRIEAAKEGTGDDVGSGKASGRLLGMLQLQQVPLAEYQAHRRRLGEAEAPGQFLRRLHHDPVSAMQRLVDRYLERTELIRRASTPGVVVP